MTIIRCALASPRRLDVLAASGLAQLDRTVCAKVPDLVRATLSVPCALLSLMGERRQAIIRASGLPPEAQAIGAIPMEQSVCRYVVAGGHGLAIEDTERNVLTSGNDLLRRSALRSYIGMPLRFGGEVVGTLCAFDTQVREWTAREACVLSHIARFTEYEMAVGGCGR